MQAPHAPPLRKGDTGYDPRDPDEDFRGGRSSPNAAAIMTPAEASVQTRPDPPALAEASATWLLQRALHAGPRFTLALSGGATPRLLYEVLAQPPFKSAFPWHKTDIFWGDERCAPDDDALSNYAMARAALLDHVPIPPSHIHPAYVSGPPDAAAAAYAAALQRQYGGSVLHPTRDLFDVTLLGLGTDGHTASLFPGAPALEEHRAWVTAVTDHAPPRLTLTYGALAASTDIAFVVTGAEKSAMLHRLRRADPDLPAGRVTARCITIFADTAAMS